MDLAEWLLKNHWKDLLPPTQNWWSSIRKTPKGDVIGKNTGLNYDELGRKLNKMTDTLEAIEENRKLTEKLTKENPKGLPF